MGQESESEQQGSNEDYLSDVQEEGSLNGFKKSELGGSSKFDPTSSSSVNISESFSIKLANQSNGIPSSSYGKHQSGQIQFSQIKEENHEMDPESQNE